MKKIILVITAMTLSSVMFAQDTKKEATTRQSPAVHSSKPVEKQAPHTATTPEDAAKSDAKPASQDVKKTQTTQTATPGTHSTATQTDAQKGDTKAASHEVRKAPAKRTVRHVDAVKKEAAKPAEKKEEAK